MRIDDNTVTLVLIVVAGIVVALAIWLGRGLKARKTKAGYELEVQSQAQSPEASGGIQVARGAKITGSTVGDIAGIKIEGDSPPGAVPDRIQVFDQGTLKNVQAGDIAGVKKTTPPKSAP